MRDIALLIIVGGLLPWVLMRPQVGIYAWSWLGYMNPHKLAFGFAYNFPFAQSVALATLLSILFWKQPKRIPMNGLVVLWFAFLAWILITTIFAFYSAHAWDQYTKVMKIQLIIFLTIMVIRTRKEVDILLWVIALSIGFYGIKGGVFTIKTLGGGRVWGPSGGYIQENNALAVALLMVLPLFYYLRMQAKITIVRHLMLGAMLLMTISVIGSQSRGALLAICATGGFLWLKTPGKLLSGILMVFLAMGIYSFMPQSWHDRMGLIENYQEDNSAMGRIAAWKMAFNLGNGRITGGGFNTWKAPTYRLYSDNPADWNRYTAAHSIYFNMIGEHGWIGFILFVSIFISAWRMASGIIKEARGSPDLKWAADLMRMMHVSFIAYGVGGAFLQLSYFDLPWHLVSIIIICRVIVTNELNNEAKNEALPQRAAGNL